MSARMSVVCPSSIVMGRRAYVASQALPFPLTFPSLQSLAAPVSSGYVQWRPAVSARVGRQQRRRRRLVRLVEPLRVDVVDDLVVDQVADRLVGPDQLKAVSSERTSARDSDRDSTHRILVELTSLRTGCGTR